MAKNKAKNEAKNAEAETTDEGAPLSWKERQGNKLAKVAALLTSLEKSAAIDAKGKGAVAALDKALQSFGQWFITLPEDFRITVPGQGSNRKIEPGDEVHIIDELVELYPCGKGPHKVLKVTRYGGQEGTGRGGKVFVLCDTKRGQLVIPGSALE